jgi:hypothetical protein
MDVARIGLLYMNAMLKRANRVRRAAAAAAAVDPAAPARDVG